MVSRWTCTVLPVPVQLVLPSSPYTGPFREISRPPVTRSAPVAGRAAVPGTPLPAQEDGQADDERHANYQRRSQRRQVLPHSTALLLTRRGPCSRWACIVSCATPMLISPLR